MTEQIKLFEEITLFDEQDVFASCPAHGNTARVKIPGCDSLSDGEVQKLVRLLPIYSSWPKRDWGTSGVGDIYSYLKCRQIGAFEPIRAVKENEHWVLDGRVMFTGGDRLNHQILTQPRLVALSMDIDRGDPTKGRQVFQLSRLLVSPK